MNSICIILSWEVSQSLNSPLPHITAPCTFREQRQVAQAESLAFLAKGDPRNKEAEAISRCAQGSR